MPDFEQQYQNNPDINSEINTAILGQTIPNGYQSTDPYTDALIKANQAQFAPEAIGPQGAALYPGLKHDINVGTYSGSIVGSNPIFVPGGNILAVDPLLARQKAIADAAKKRASSLERFEFNDPYKLKDARFQKDFNQKYYNRAKEYWDEAVSKYGKDAGLVLKDKGTEIGNRFLQEMKNYEVMGQKFDQIVDLAAGMKEGMLDKSKEYTDDIRKKLNDYENMIGNFEKGDIWAIQDLDKMYNELKGYRSFEDYIQDDNFFKDFLGKETSSGYILDKGAYYNVRTGSKIKYEDGIRDAAKSLLEGPFREELMRGYINEDYAYRAIRARLQDQEKLDQTMQQKTATTVKGETTEIIAGGEGFNTYSKENPGPGLMPTYNPLTGERIYNVDKEGNKIDPVNMVIKPRAEYQMTIKGKEKTIHERDPTSGRYNEVKFNGIQLDNIQVLDGDGAKEKTIPGSVYAELGEIVALDDGRMVQRAKMAVPTQSTKKTQRGGMGTAEDDFDSYTIQDRFILLEHANNKKTGAATEIKSKGLTTDESRKKYDDAYQKARGVIKSEAKVDEYGRPIN